MTTRDNTSSSDTDRERLDAIRQKANENSTRHPRGWLAVYGADVTWLLTRLAALEHERDDYRECYEDMRRNVRRIDVAMHGEDGAATSPSACDLIGPAEDLRLRAQHAEAALLSLQTAVRTFTERCQEIRDGSPNAFYAHVDRFCKAALLPDPAGTIRTKADDASARVDGDTQAPTGRIYRGETT